MLEAITDAMGSGMFNLAFVLVGLPLAGFILGDVWRAGRRGVERAK